MKTQKDASAPRGSACPKKVTELFYVTRPKVPKALLGPFLTEADAEYGRLVMHSAGAQVTVCLVDAIDEFTHWRAVNNGRVCRAFAESTCHE